MQHSGCVYALGDPRDGEIRYVGYTVDLFRRLSLHRSETKRGHPNRVYQWLREIESPVVVVLEHSCPKERELVWIGRFRGLLNTRGYDGNARWF